jgi:hypothetical protein
VQNLSERLQYILAEVVAVKLAPEGSQLIKMAPRPLKNTVKLVFDAAIVGRTFVGTSSADTHHILS